MSNINNDAVFQLIKSLTRSEKRHFRLFTNRQGSNEGLKFLHVFDALDSQEQYDDEKVLKQVPAIKKAQLANLKANLYKQLLSSLRLYHANQNLDIQLHEQLDYARVLYNKGLYQQSLKMLDKVKLAAQQAALPHIALEALDFEKQIETQYITRSLQGRAESLSAEATQTVRHVAQVHDLSNVALRLYGLYIKMGHARNREDHDSITTYFKENLPNLDLPRASFTERLYYYQANVWYYYIVQDFRACYRYAQKWVSLFEEEPAMKEKQASHYIKGLHNLLAALYNLLYYSKFKAVLQKLEDFAADPDRRQSANTEMLLFLYIYTNRLNAYFMEGRFSEGLQIVPEILENLDRYQLQLDSHRRLVFYFKIASLYFGSGDYPNTIKYLNKIINFKDVSLREDLQCFARILNLIAHYDSGQDEALEYQIKSTYHFLGKMNNQQPMQKEIFKFLRELSDINPLQLRGAFISLKEKLMAIADNPVDRRPFLYLDIISWLESKIENIPVQEVMKRKFHQMK
ncbi:hypothetical protein CLV24_10885 [Pontibacter ummariensis]|uniref:Tetratricopeptide repeat-containing protein n=1 Tax=Pontibacter ummariensis TaxID=1610492 RepID=A0A239FAT6_9BACT|nr:hypothetical protein [Pontibacter ummariensis]PRY12341.1 hypothetical protein CLV24_10885 [Pontibacter ummariensis]SNS54009.1 hypothetical protein SAMN06296052_108100 [Pontibacter ummariensis]